MLINHINGNTYLMTSINKNLMISFIKVFKTNISMDFK